MEHLLTWKSDDGLFRLELWDTHQKSYGKYVLAYKFFDKEWTSPSKALFEGSDFSPAPSDAIDSVKSVASLLGFLALMPGDTDDEYFIEYTTRQMGWAESSRADELKMDQTLLEEAKDWDDAPGSVKIHVE